MAQSREWALQTLEGLSSTSGTQIKSWAWRHMLPLCREGGGTGGPLRLQSAWKRKRRIKASEDDAQVEGTVRRGHP